MPPWLGSVLAIVLVALNGFFVAAEFALVKVRGSQVEELVRQRRPFSQTAQWLTDRLEGALSTCQLGITMASLGLGWIAEPAFEPLLSGFFKWMGIESEATRQIIAITIAFTTITALHLVIGEQAPKIFAIRRPENMILWCAVLLKFFYVISYPFMISLTWSTSVILRSIGVAGTGEHETPHTEEEIKALLREAHIHGDVTGSEHRLINAVFEFDDTICRRVMVPRTDVEYFDTSQSLSSCLESAKHSRHTRFPLCDGSLDKVVGVIHIKDLIGFSSQDDLDIRTLARPPKQVPETIPISRLLRHFQASRQHLAFVVDEYGTTSGIVTLENVLEQIVGPVEDEFDLETPDIVPDGPGQYIVQGSASVDVVRRVLNLNLEDKDADTFSGLLMTREGEILEAGDRIELDGATAEVLEVKSARATRVRVTLGDSAVGDSKDG